MPVNQKQIAQMLGINRASVSKALSDSPEISEAVKQKVRALCEELGYTPNYHARSLLTNKTGVIAILKQNLRLSSLLSDWVDCIQTVASEKGYKVRLEHIQDVGRTIAEQSADGFISFHTPNEEPEMLRHLTNTERPIVFTDCGITDFTNNAVIIDNLGASRGCVEHLADLGHRHIAFFGFVIGNGPCRDRLQGFLDRSREMGLSVANDMVISSSYWPFEIEDTYVHEREIIQLVKQGVTAFICSSDINAVGVMKLLRRNGFSIPNDISVIGFDDSLTARACEPPLTSVRQMVMEASRQAVELVLKIRETKELHKTIMVPAEMVTRYSTAPPPSTIL